MAKAVQTSPNTVAEIKLLKETLKKISINCCSKKYKFANKIGKHITAANIVDVIAMSLGVDPFTFLTIFAEKA
mgnify:CR=1 FL=1